MPKHIHIIGICGVATSAIAIAFHESGVKVTGSDKGFFPPVSTELEKHKVPFYAGWHPEKMVAEGKPDIIMVGTASGTQNPETIYAKEHGIPMLSYPEILGKYFVKKNSIVAAGTWGKTSSSTLLSFILEQAGFDPSYMFGGISLSHDAAAKLTDSDWSVLEGDEYKSSPTDSRAKFFHYKPTHLLLTAVSWDHADLYRNEEDYFEAFEKLVKSIPHDGLIVGNADQAGSEKVIADTNKKVTWYGKSSDADYIFHSVKQSQNGIDFTILNKDAVFNIHSPMLGAYQAENITGCFAMAHNLGIEAEKIVASIAKFKGLKRRLEKRLEAADSASGVNVIDDIAHSPEKASSVLSTLRDIYKGKIVAVFEPNIGGRKRDAVAKYDSAFKDADTVIIPRLTKLKVADNEADQPIEGDELVQIISKTHRDAKYIEDDSKLVHFLKVHTKKGDVIAFLGSHGFRGMIEEVTKE